MLTNLLLIVFSACFVVDFSGVMPKLNRLYHLIINGKKKAYNGISIPLLSCSLCVTFWTTFIYCAVNNFNIIYIIGISSINAFLSVFITRVMDAVYCKLNVLIDKINETER